VAAAWDRTGTVPDALGARYPLSPETLERMQQKGMEPLVANDLQPMWADERLDDAQTSVLVSISTSGPLCSYRW